MTTQPTILLILDGYGIAKEGPGNAVTLAKTPSLDAFMEIGKENPLAASGLDVGLPQGYMGNSEVGHLNIGAGRIVYQDMARIDKAIEDGSFLNNPAIQELFAKTKAQKGRLHLMGLLSDGGVHSHIDHTLAIAQAAKEQEIPVIIHALMDGRDTSPQSGQDFMQYLIEKMPKAPFAKVGSIIGRYYAMDRDTNWDRVEKAFSLFIHGQADTKASPLEYIKSQYAIGITDEFMPPCLCLPSDEACLKDNDSVFFTNFRADRMRELVHALSDKEFSFFPRGKMPKFEILCMSPYDASLSLPVAFDKELLSETLGETLSKHGIRQLRIAETEKYAHVTYFFNGGREEAFPFEERVLIASDKSVPTYDLRPQMRAQEVVDGLLAHIKSGEIDFFVCNIANPDMVGHTGNLEATCQALEAVDFAFAKLFNEVAAKKGRLIVTADHGNAEYMLDIHGQPATAHTCNPVPFAIFEGGKARPLCPEALKTARLADIAPTILACLNIKKPQCMSGKSLLL